MPVYHDPSDAVNFDFVWMKTEICVKFKCPQSWAGGMTTSQHTILKFQEQKCKNYLQPSNLYTAFDYQIIA
jgi:hypothetical protein